MTARVIGIAAAAWALPAPATSGTAQQQERSLTRDDFLACNERAMQTAGITGAGAGAASTRTPGPNQTTVHKGPAPESRFSTPSAPRDSPAASPGSDAGSPSRRGSETIPPASGATTSTVPKAEVSRIVLAYEECLSQRIAGSAPTHEREGEPRPGSGGGGSRPSGGPPPQGPQQQPAGSGQR